jgi:hypothetical protein
LIDRYNKRVNKIILVSPSDGATGSERDKENVREWKILTEPVYIWI